MIRRLLSISAAACLAVSCTPNSQTDSNATSGAASSSSSASTQGDAVKIVASTQVWADVAEQVVPGAHITAIVSGQDTDPHSFEPAAADLAKAKEADIVVVGGGGYDAWLYQAVDEAKVVHALPLTTGHHHGDHEHGDHDHGDHDHEGHSHEGHSHEMGSNEHVWFDDQAVTDLAKDLAAKVGETAPDAQTTPEKVAESLQSAHEMVAALPAVKIAQTHPIADLLVSDSKLEDVTPEGYHHSALNEAEPTAADVSAFLDAIEQGEMKVLIDAPQTATDATRRIREAAEKKGIKVVDVYEMPAKGENYFDFYSDFVKRLADATK